MKNKSELVNYSLNKLFLNKIRIYNICKIIHEI